MVPFVGTFVGATIAIVVTALADGGSSGTLLSVAGVILCNPPARGRGADAEDPSVTASACRSRVQLFAVVAGGKLLGASSASCSRCRSPRRGAVLARLAMSYYEHTQFFGHESDAELEMPQAMMPIWPGGGERP